MKRKLSGILAVFMAFMIAATTVMPETVYAAQAPEKTAAGETVSENRMTPADETTVSENNEDAFGEKGKLNYLYLESKYIESPGEQTVLVGYGDEETVIEKGVLEVRNYRTKETVSYSSTETMDNTVLFQMPFTETQQGIYEVIAVVITTADGEEKRVALSETGMANVYFGVDEEVVETEETVTADPSVEMQIVTFDEEGISDVQTEDITAAVEDALGEAESNTPVSYAAKAGRAVLSNAVESNGRSANGEIVVVLDPGHDASHAGARANGLKEEELTLKIAQYCKEELEQYSGVRVYMTRTSSACPYPGTTSTVDNKSRVDYAKSVGADIFVSIHLNSSSSASAKGAEVFYPNSHYNSSIGTQGANLAKQISRQLVALGLNNRDITIKNSEDNTLYPDGSLADYYGVIRNSKLAGFPAVIVEHAFLTNAGDAAFLSSEANLKKIGIADAVGIANYLGVSKTIDIKSNAPVIQNLNNGAGTFGINITGVSPLSSVSSVAFAVWNSENGQDDLVWYTAANAGNGTFTANVNINKHGSKTGTYFVHAYAYDVRGTAHFLGSTQCSFTKIEMSVGQLSANVSADEKTATIVATNATGIGTLQFAVWSNGNGQDDLKWYTATNNGNGIYTAVVPISSHKGSTGVYNVHAYASNAYSANTFMKNTTFTIEGPKAGTITFENVNNGAGTFRARLSGSSAKAGISNVKFAVWSTSNQSNLVWYNGTRQSDGAYTVDVDLSKHGYQYGLYQVHAYIIDGNGASVLVTNHVEIKQPTPVLTATGNGNQTQFNIKAGNVGYAGGVKGVSIAVWSSVGGQDDLRWYQAQKQGNGTWSVNVPIVNHKSAGTYNAHMYIVDGNGGMHFGASTTFTVEGPKAGTVTFENVNNTTGAFRARIAGSTAKAGISSVRFAVWSKSDQSNLVWYNGTKQSDGAYTADIDLAKHGYEYGLYQVHVYVTDSNGVSTVTAKSIDIKQPVIAVTAAGNGNQTQFNIKAGNVGYAGGAKGVSIAVWSSAGGQDDLRWYQAQNQGNGTWSTNVLIANHKTAGTYNAHVYIVDQKGGMHFGGSTTFTVEGPKAGTLAFENVNNGAGTFRARIAGSTAKAGISSVRFAVWSTSNQSNLAWYDGTKQSDGAYTADIDLAKHGYQYGVYQVHVYVTDSNGISVLTAKSIEMKQPTALVTATGNGNQTQFNIKAGNVGYAGGVKGVSIAVWSSAGGQDDLRWYQAQNLGNGTWSANALIANHKTAGTYNAHMYIVDQNGGMHFGGSATFTVEGPKGGTVSVFNRNESDGTFGVSATGVSSLAGIQNVRFAVWCAPNQSDIVWYTGTDMGGGAYHIGADVRNHKSNTGTYQIHVYVTDNNGISKLIGTTTTSMVNVTNILHPIMGSTSVTADQMAAYYNSVTSYPSYYANTEAPTIRQFCQIYINECNAEGVKAEVAFVQAMKETNFLRYTGDVDISQFNFAGLGATGNGVKGNSFSSVTIGIRAQVQHLKAYASNEALNQACVDPRFQYVQRNTAPYCEWLGINENPYGKGWATAVNYGYNIVSRVNTLKTY